MARFLLTHAVDHWAERRPESEAVQFEGNGLSYAGLAGRSNQVARVLIAQGVRRGDRVGIYMTKSLESVVSVYGIMKAGAAYVPLDPFAPPARVAFVLEDCGIRHLLSRPEKEEALAEVLSQAVGVRHLIGAIAGGVESIGWEEVESASDDPVLGADIVEQDLAYILYTSGSTGVPKGIMHSHRSGLSFAEWAASEYQLVEGDRLSNHAPLHFDLSTFDIFAGHIAGAATVVIPEGVTKFPASMARLIETEQISIWYSVPFALVQLLLHAKLESRNLDSLRWVLFAGEPFPTKHLRDLMAQVPQARFSNLFGPTETNVCTYYHVSSIAEDSDEPIPIGRSCANVEALIVDEADNPVEERKTGELVIRGGIVMRGYWGQPGRTTEAFLRRQIAGGLEEAFYRTGDLVRYDSDGNLHYLGRKDRQIKTRGYRVELDEIEVALLAHESVDEAAVYPVPDGQGSNLIEAAVVPRPGTAPDLAELMEHLAGRLPPYALPVRLAITEVFPRTSTGKIDRRTLQARAANSAA